MLEVTKLPLEIDKLQDFISSDDKVLNIDYNLSKPLRTIGFLSYIANLNITANVKLNEIPKDELEEMLIFYLTTKQLIDINDFNYLTAALILNIMDIDYTKAYNLPINKSFLDEFCVKHKELLTNYYVFISSLSGYSYKVIDDMLDEEHELEDYSGIIADINWVGTNVVNLFKIESFLELFFSNEKLDYPQFYFKVQFEEFAFNGHTLSKFFVGDLGNKQWLVYIASQTPKYKERLDRLFEDEKIRIDSSTQSS